MTSPVRRADTPAPPRSRGAARPRPARAVPSPSAGPDAADWEPARAAGPPRNSDFVQSLDRGLAVIRAFGPDRERLSLSEVARATGLTRAATRRFLLTLVQLGYVRNDGREFSLRPRVLELGYAYLSGLALPEIAAPHLEELVATVRESSSISVLDGDHIVYVARVPTKRIMTVAISVGTRFPAYATSMGRVLLAGMSPDEFDAYLGRADLAALTGRTVTSPDQLRAIVSEVSRQGYAIVDQELEEGLRAIAAPIHGAGGAVTAAINVSAHASRVSLAAMKTDLLPGLLETARRIEADLRSQGRA
ncbi:MAG TPA: IclR family transcriptional regulator C-terminal domain-containing protein [Streptosporangiaceae bacterium]|nr:IclR family transcriptional regulator C-terminal domain-containing protein [Streptosporangiaceae bacterium]